jgi:hypothetical protein
LVSGPDSISPLQALPTHMCTHAYYIGSTSVILSGCAARFARRTAKVSRPCHIEKIIKTVSFNINFEKEQEKNVQELYQIYFLDDLLAYN